jgi:signal transduction histidine kinase/ActR/RegA family two-component response regulator
MPVFAELATGRGPAATSAKPYLLALVGVFAAFSIRYALTPYLGDSIPVVLFTVPVVAAAVYGGYGPAMFATILGSLSSTYFFVPDYYSFTFHNGPGVLIAATFLVTGICISLLGKRLHFLKLQTEAQAQALQLESRKKDEFLAVLAHELRNPLSGISTAAELLKYARSDEHRLNSASEVIARQVDHMTRLVDDLLDVSRLTRGLAILEKNPVDMTDIVHDAIEQTQSLCDEKGHHLAIRLPAGPACVCGDHTRLVQVVANLLSNAARYTPDGGHIALTVLDDGKQVEVQVQDNGQGMAPELLPHIFNPFAQAERRRDRAQGGLGLGLALVQKITDLHEGTVEAHSAGPGQGSTFTLRLPRWHKSASTNTLPDTVRQTHREEERERVASAEPLTIMVVDDNQDAADGLASLLERQGHTVLVAYSGKQALDLAPAEDIDVFLLDIDLPDMDGYELSRLLRRIPLASTATFIAVTGLGRKEDKERAQAAGFQHHFVKPVRAERLFDVLNNGASAK